MPMRDQEVEVIPRVRAKYAKGFAVAERILDLGYDLVFNQQIKHPGGDILLGRVLLALYCKMLANFWSIIVLAERQLPTSSVMRELTEALIAFAYIAKEDSSARAELYRDYLVIRDSKDLNRRQKDPDSRDTVTPEYAAAVQKAIQDLEANRGMAAVKAMKDWPTWAGSFSLETMARRAGLPGTVYTLAYSVDSRSIHAMDAADFLRPGPAEGTLQPVMPPRVEQHLFPASAALTVAMDMLADQCGLNRKDEILAVHQEVRRLAEERRQRATEDAG